MEPAATVPVTVMFALLNSPSTGAVMVTTGGAEGAGVGVGVGVGVGAGVGVGIGWGAGRFTVSVAVAGLLLLVDVSVNSVVPKPTSIVAVKLPFLLALTVVSIVPLAATLTLAPADTLPLIVT